MKNKNGIEFVPTPKKKRDCVNHRTGRAKRVFSSEVAARQFIAVRADTFAYQVRVYQCDDGHFHLTTTGVPNEASRANESPRTLAERAAEDDIIFEPARRD